MLQGSGGLGRLYQGAMCQVWAVGIMKISMKHWPAQTDRNSKSISSSILETSHVSAEIV